MQPRAAFTIPLSSSLSASRARARRRAACPKVFSFPWSFPQKLSLSLSHSCSLARDGSSVFHLSALAYSGGGSLGQCRGNIVPLPHTEKKSRLLHQAFPLPIARAYTYTHRHSHVLTIRRYNARGDIGYTKSIRKSDYGLLLVFYSASRDFDRSCACDPSSERKWERFLSYSAELRCILIIALCVYEE